MRPLTPYEQALADSRGRDRVRAERAAQVVRSRAAQPRRRDTRKGHRP